MSDCSCLPYAHEFPENRCENCRLRDENAELRKDRERLEWLLAGGEVYEFEDGKWEAYDRNSCLPRSLADDWREAIDEAMTNE